MLSTVSDDHSARSTSRRPSGRVAGQALIQASDLSSCQLTMCSANVCSNLSKDDSLRPA